MTDDERQRALAFGQMLDTIKAVRDAGACELLPAIDRHIEKWETIRAALQSPQVKQEPVDQQYLWDMVVKQDTGELEASFTVNWLRGVIKIPREVKLRIQQEVNPVAVKKIEGLADILERVHKSSGNTWPALVFASNEQADTALETIRSYLELQGGE